MNTLLRITPLALCLLCAAPSVAYASDPMSVYARVDQVSFEPNEASAVRVRIDGVFAIHKPPPAPPFTYSDPQAGYMYYSCPTGQETNCRAQWADIKTGIGGFCVGWGQDWLSAGADAAVPEGTVRAPSAPPSSPDVYDLGMGVMPAASAGGICPKLLAYARSDGGNGDSGPSNDAATGGSRSGAASTAGSSGTAMTGASAGTGSRTVAESSGATSSGGGAGSGTTASGAASTGGASSGSPAAPRPGVGPPTGSGGGGCVMSQASSAGPALALMALLGAVSAFARRRGRRS